MVSYGIWTVAFSQNHVLVHFFPGPTSDFGCTLCRLLQQCEVGGEFEFAPFVRGEASENGKRDENWPALKRLFNGEYPSVLKKVTAGTLNLFCGNRSMHRVRTVYGPKKRIMAVLSYDTIANKTATKEVNVMLYGDRINQVYAAREGTDKELSEMGRGKTEM